LSSGNVGIGTTGFAGTSNAVNLTTSGASGAITVLANGNVGIGTTNPTAKLHVNGTVNIPSGGLICPGIVIGFAYDTYSTLFNIPNTMTTYTASGLAITYTAKSASSKILVIAVPQVNVENSAGANAGIYVKMYKNAVASDRENFIYIGGGGVSTVDYYNPSFISYIWENTSATSATYTMYVKFYTGNSNALNPTGFGTSYIYLFEFAN